MGKVVDFPLIRRRPHVALVWDWAWGQYRVEPVGILAPSAPIEFHDDYGMALDCLIGMGERLALPAVDCTQNGRVAS